MAFGSYKKRSAGLRAKRDGDGFELALKRMMGRAGWHLLRIENGCKTMGVGGKRLMRVVQPFDFVGMGPNGVDIFFDAKSRSGAKRVQGSWLRGGVKKKGSRTVLDSSAMQYQKLKEVASLGRIAGWVVYLKDTDEVWWVPVEYAEDPMSGAILWGTSKTVLNVKFQ